MRFFMKQSLKDQYYQAIDMRPVFEWMVSEVKKGNDVVFHDAPTIIAFVSERRNASNQVNAQLAVQNASLACDSLGIGSYYCSFPSLAANRDQRILSALKLTKERNVNGIIALGYPKLKLNKWIERDVNASWL